MAEIRYPIRQALKSQDIRQEDLAKSLGISRQTVTRYLTQFETCGYVNNPAAQKEFERLMAIERQRLSGMQDNKSRLEKARMALESASERERNNNVRYERLLRDILANHPDVTMYDWEDRPVTLETLDLEKNWVNMDTFQNEDLDAVLTESERSRLKEIDSDISETFRMCDESSCIEQACIAEQIWDSTEPCRKPILYRDRFECAITEEEAKDGLYEFECDSFCMCSGGTARIYVEDLNMLGFVHNIEVEVFAVIEVITDKGLMYIDSIKLEKPENNYPFRYVGQTDNLIPGYKYIYTLGITAGDYDELDDREYTLLEGYSTKETHPLK